MSEVLKMIIEGSKLMFAGIVVLAGVVIVLVLILAVLVAAYCYIEGWCGVGGNTLGFPRNKKSLGDVFTDYFWKKGEMRWLTRRAKGKK